MMFFTTKKAHLITKKKNICLDQWKLKFPSYLHAYDSSVGVILCDLNPWTI